MQRIVHPIAPVYREDSRILILGSFPSVKSREQMFFYGHPQNRFWRVVAAVFGDAFPETVSERQDFLLRHRVAAWDVIRSCEIAGSSDASIRNVVPNDLRPILQSAEIRAIFVNGKQRKPCIANTRSRSPDARQSASHPQARPTPHGAWSG